VAEPLDGQAPMTRRAMLALLAFGVGVLVDQAWARLVRGFHLERPEYPKMILGRYRIHHSVVGYAAVVAGVFVYPGVLIPLGIGLILSHGMRDGPLWFIERMD